MFSSAFWDACAHKMSAFTCAAIDDWSGYHPQSLFWLENYALNRESLRFSGKDDLYAFNYFRRTQEAFRAHQKARETTLEFLARPKSLRRYFIALDDWELYLQRCIQAYECWARFFDKKGQIFQKGSGMLEERVWGLHNISKHADSAIADDKQPLPTGATTPIWLENSGLCSATFYLTWDETGEVLKELAKWAEILEHPVTTGEKLQALTAQ